MIVSLNTMLLKISDNLLTGLLYTFLLKISMFQLRYLTILIHIPLTKINFLYIVVEPFGGVAHLARALAWHARGKGFKSPHLHHKPTSAKKSVYFFKPIVSELEIAT